MHLDFHPETDLWSYLKTTEKPIVLYGMGNGADKLLRVAAHRGITVSGIFASNGFVRGHSFHDMPVESYSDICARYGKGRFIVLLSFASALPEVLENIERIASETELYAPDLPVVTDDEAEADTNADLPIFDLAYYRTHEKEIAAAYALLKDDESRKIFRSVLFYRLSGRIDLLRAAESEKETVYSTLLHPASYRAVADLGAYNGDTVRELLPYTKDLQEVYCLEPDPRTYRKLSAYAEAETRTRVIPLPYAAWSSRETRSFDGSGNRNSSLRHRGRQKEAREVECDSLTHLLERYGAPRLDYIKFDVEGSEKEAFFGSLPLILRDRPELLVSLYHRREDLFALPLLLAEHLPNYTFYLRRFPYIPAWDLNLYAIPN